MTTCSFVTETVDLDIVVVVYKRAFRYKLIQRNWPVIGSTAIGSTVIGSTVIRSTGIGSTVIGSTGGRERCNSRADCCKGLALDTPGYVRIQEQALICGRDMRIHGSSGVR